ncbi:MAG: hypothetical protein IPK53_10785 [bacterium]|nr:hypothetical protein [bacterium]
MTLTNVIITATLPAGTTAVPGSISDGGLVGEGNIHWNFLELLQDQTTIVSFTCTNKPECFGRQRKRPCGK